MATAASKRGVLEGAAAIELRAIDPSTAADYLCRVQLDPPPQGWHDLIDRIREQSGPLAHALDNPLTLTLVRDTYRAGDDVRELVEFCDTTQRRVSGDRLAEDITDHLLGRVLPAAYAQRPGEGASPYDLQTAQRALTKIAARMNQYHSRDLRWWDLPDWAPATPRILAVRLAGGLVVGLAAGLAAGLVFGLVFGLIGSPAWSYSLTFAQLARRWHTPVRLMRFLDDARERGVLRTVGPVYQFRHARLQDHLARQDSNLTAAKAIAS